MKRNMPYIFLLLCLVVSACVADLTPEAIQVSTQTTAWMGKPAPSPSATPTPGVDTPVPAEVTFTPVVNYRIHGINISPYLSSDPNLGAYVEESTLRSLIERVAPYTTSIRTYGCGNGLDKAARIAHDLGLTIAAGAWLGPDHEANRKEIQCLIDLANNGELFDSDIAVLGKETLLRGDLTESELIAYIDGFKQEVPWVPVTTAESWKNIEHYPDLIARENIVFVNVYPYTDGTRVDRSASIVSDWYIEFHKFVGQISPDYDYMDDEGNFVRLGGKDIIIAETGWPSCGNGGGGAHESFYFGSFTSLARAYNLKFYWFEAYDESWKVKYEGGAGGCWGLWDKDGNLKKNLDVTFSSIVGGISDPEIEIISPSPYNDPLTVRGMAWHIIPKDYRVVVYIFVPDSGGWWVKPSPQKPLTPIEISGYWECEAFTEGTDANATKVAAFLIPVEYTPPLAEGWDTLPQEMYDRSVANAIVDR